MIKLTKEEASNRRAHHGGDVSSAFRLLPTFTKPEPTSLTLSGLFSRAKARTAVECWAALAHRPAGISGYCPTRTFIASLTALYCIRLTSVARPSRLRMKCARSRSGPLGCPNRADQPLRGDRFREDLGIRPVLLKNVQVARASAEDCVNTPFPQNMGSRENKLAAKIYVKDRASKRGCPRQSGRIRHCLCWPKDFRSRIPQRALHIKSKDHIILSN